MLNICNICLYCSLKTVRANVSWQLLELLEDKKEVVSACSSKETKLMVMSFSIVVSFLVCNSPFATVFIAAGTKSYTYLL